MRLIIIFILLSISGCATVKVQEVSSVDLKIGTIPELGQQTVAPVGGTIFSQFKYVNKLPRSKLTGY